MEHMKREWGQLLIGERIRYSRNSFRTRLNNNVLVAGASGSGKTTGIVIPNIRQAKGSYIIVDPKGNLYTEYCHYLHSRGYEVKKLSFINPKGSCGYNFFRYIHNEQDVLRIAHLLVYGNKSVNWKMDPFWDEATELLLSAIIGYLWEFHGTENQNLENVMKLLNACEVHENDPEKQTPLDRILLVEARRQKSDAFCLKQYEKFRVAAGRTLKSILISTYARIGRFDWADLNQMMKTDEVNIASIGQRKTAVFVEVSDTDRSMDQLANLFFTQAMQELCRYADECTIENRLPVEVQFIMDDFATNCNIVDFPRMIASIRSRGISAMLLVQSEAQLEQMYGPDSRTIIGNCDTYVYLGGNDLDTARSVAERCDVPVQQILNLPVGDMWIFRRGSKPRRDNIFQDWAWKREPAREEGEARDR